MVKRIIKACFQNRGKSLFWKWRSGGAAATAVFSDKIFGLSSLNLGSSVIVMSSRCLISLSHTHTRTKLYVHTRLTLDG